jgi:hypothetical protein
MYLRNARIAIVASLTMALIGSGAAVFLNKPGTHDSVAVAADPPKPADRKPLPALKDVKPLQPEAGDDELRKLQKERYNAARDEYRFHTGERFEIADKHSALAEAADVLQRWLKSALDLAQGPNDQIAVLEQFLTEAKDMEDIIKTRVQAGINKKGEGEKTRYFRLDIEIQLLKAKRAVAK